MAAVLSSLSSRFSERQPCAMRLLLLAATLLALLLVVMSSSSARPYDDRVSAGGDRTLLQGQAPAGELDRSGGNVTAAAPAPAPANGAFNHSSSNVSTAPPPPPAQAPAKTNQSSPSAFRIHSDARRGPVGFNCC